MAARRWTYGLGRNLVLLGLVSLFTDVSSEMVFPLIPFFVIALGGNAFIVGAVEGAAESLGSFVKILSGHGSDRSGRRKPFVVGGYGLSTFAKFLYPVAPAWPAFLGMRLADRTGKGVRDPPRDAIIAESTPADALGKAFGFHRAMDTVGAIVGPIVAFLLLSSLLAGGGDLVEQLPALRSVFFLAAFPATIALAISLAVRDVVAAPRDRRLRASLRSLTPRLRAFVAIAALHSFANVSYVFLILRVGSAEGTSAAILFYLLFNVVYAANATLAGGLSDRWGRLPVLVLGYGAFIGMAVGFVFLDGVVWFVVGFVLYGVGFAFVEGVHRAFATDLAPAEIRGAALGTYHMAVGLAKFPSGLVAGALFFAYGHAATFGFAALGTAVALAGLVALAGTRANS